MSLGVVRAAVHVEAEDGLHLARLVILLNALGGKKQKPVDGIMKLAKLDFLLRYPTYLERALVAAGYNRADAEVQEHERTSIESKMVRFRYGPWDGRYRRWIGILYARGLASTHLQGRTVYVGLTPAGERIAHILNATQSLEAQRTRAEALRKAFGHYSGTKLKEFIYRVFPEIIDLKWGEEILP